MNQQPADIFPKMSSQEVEPYKSNELTKLSEILDNKYPQSFVDFKGSLAVLPVDSHTSLARYIASYSISKLKRYCVHQVYSPDSSGSPPEPRTELAFDLASSERKSSQDAQVIQLIANILRDCKKSFVVLQLSHHLLVEALLVYCQVPVDQRSNFCQHLKMERGAIKRLSSQDFISDDRLELFLNLVNMKRDLNGLKAYFGGLPGWVESGAAAIADEGFKELKEIISIYKAKNRNLKKRWRYPVCIKVNVGFENYDTHSGFLFRFTYPALDVIE